MNAQIIILPSKRISVKIDWNTELHKHFKTIPKYYYNYENKLWTFPASYLEQIKEHLLNNNYTVVVEEYKPLIRIIQKEANVHILSDFHPETYKIFSQLGKWNIDIKRWIIPTNKCDDLINELNNQK